MYLVDTSVWIDFFRENNSSAVKHLIEIMDNKIPFGITAVIYQEILQGSASLHDFNQLAEYLSTQQFFHPKDPILTYENAAKLYFQCRRKGVTVRSTIDCLIAEVAIEHDLILLHHDSDYSNIKKIHPRLKLYTD